MTYGAFPGGLVVKNPLCSAGDMGLIPGQRTTIPQAMEQWSPSTTTRKPMCHKQKMLHDTTKTPHAATKTQGSQINILKRKTHAPQCSQCCSVLSSALQSHELQHSRLPCPSPFPGVCSNSCPLSQWCHPTIYLIAASFTTDKTWKQPKCPSTDERIKKICCVYTHTHTVEYYPVVKN